MAQLENDEFDQATTRAERRRRVGPTAIAAQYDHASDRIVIRLSSGLEIAFAPAAAEGLQDARPEQLDQIEITPSGFGVHFPQLDADLYLPALLKGTFGSRQWMAARATPNGRGQKRSAKAAAALIDAKPGRKARPP